MYRYYDGVIDCIDRTDEPRTGEIPLFAHFLLAIDF